MQATVKPYEVQHFQLWPLLLFLSDMNSCLGGDSAETMGRMISSHHGAWNQNKMSAMDGKSILENPGIDPGTSHMLSERSTIWANPPTCPE